METPAFTTVAKVRTLAEADMLATVLCIAGLHPVEQGTFGHFSLAGADIEYRVEVPTEEADAAREVFQSHPTNDAHA